MFMGSLDNKSSSYRSDIFKTLYSLVDMTLTIESIDIKESTTVEVYVMNNNAGIIHS